MPFAFSYKTAVSNDLKLAINKNLTEEKESTSTQNNK